MSNRHKQHNLHGGGQLLSARKNPAEGGKGGGKKEKKEKEGGGGGGIFGFFRGKPSEPTVPEGVERTSWGTTASDGGGSPSPETSPAKRERRRSLSKSNSFSLTLQRRGRTGSKGSEEGGRAGPLDARPLGKGANSDDMYSA